MDLDLKQAELIMQLRQMEIEGSRQATSSESSSCRPEQGSDSGFNSDKVRNERLPSQDLSQQC